MARGNGVTVACGGWARVDVDVDVTVNGGEVVLRRCL